MKLLEIEWLLDVISTKKREKSIQEGSELTLEKATDIARRDKMPKAQLKSVAAENPSINNVSKIKRRGHPKKSSREKFMHKDCSRCGYQHD